ncbi:YcxB family protein [Burkholderia stagnalis]
MSDFIIIFQPTLNDLVHAYRLNLWRRYTWKYLIRTFAITSIAYAVILVGSFAAVGRTLPGLHTIGVMAGIAMLATIGVPLLNHLVLPRVARKIYGQQKVLHQPHTVTCGDDRVTVESPTSREVIRYDDLLQWSEDRDMILLYQSAAMLRFIPKRALTEVQIMFLHQVLRENGVRKV